MSGNKILYRPTLPFKARKAVFEKLEDIADVASMSPEDRELPTVWVYSITSPEKKSTPKPVPIIYEHGLPTRNWV